MINICFHDLFRDVRFVELKSKAPNKLWLTLSIHVSNTTGIQQMVANKMWMMTILRYSSEINVKTTPDEKTPVAIFDIKQYKKKTPVKKCRSPQILSRILYFNDWCCMNKTWTMTKCLRHIVAQLLNSDFWTTTTLWANDYIHLVKVCISPNTQWSMIPRNVVYHAKPMTMPAKKAIKLE